MCGRYTLSTVDGSDIAQRFSLVEPPAAETLGRFNVCPTEAIAVVHEPQRADAVRWGLRPFRNSGFAPINVRAETAGTRFKFLMKGGRCLVLADGWYEWLKQERKGGPRLPFRYTVDGGAPFAFAGLYDGTGAAILTTAANAVCAPVHDRMPVVLEGPEAEAAWLSGDVGVDEALEFLLPLEDRRVAVAPANPAVNKAGVEGPELLTPPSESLF
ncbi:MAG TPA: SOS response-associated peptidase [Solirubrobacter sp.]|nr:SOS response-associated peptidase [Solirubrobacter sp.]